jgi:hypothetical protein
MQFANFGFDPRGRTACNADVGLAQSATIKGRRVRRWRTGRGLRGGDRRSRLLDAYPDAEQHGRRWWLVSAESPFGEGGRVCGLRAGKVTYVDVFRTKAEALEAAGQRE